MNPGLHPNVSEDDYNRIPAVRSTSLRELIKHTPAHCRHLEQFGGEGSKAKDEGYLFHLAVLEPDRFDRCVDVLPDFGAMQSSFNRAKRDAHLAAHPDTHWVKPEVRDELLYMRDAVYDNPTAAYLLTSAGINEATLVWDDVSGLRMKARADRLVSDFQDKACVVDLKRTKDASPWAFGRAVWDYRYDVQLALYGRGMDALFGEADRFSIFICCEPFPPYAVATYELGAEELAIGRRDLELALQTYAQCVESGVWRGYPDALVPVRLPGFVYKRNDEEMGL